MASSKLSFLYWMGSKDRLLTQIDPFLPVSFTNYYEPFLGAGTLYFHLLRTGRIKRNQAYLSDINSRLILGYLGLRDDVIQTLHYLSLHQSKHSKAYFNRNKHNQYFNLPEVAGHFLYINRCLYSGIYRENSIGMVNVIARNEAINWLTPADYYMFSGRLQDTSIACESYVKALSNVPENSFVYVDPPYQSFIDFGHRTIYNHSGFSSKNQIELYERLQQLSQNNVKIMHSNSDSPLILDLYKDWHIRRVKITYKVTSAQVKGNRTHELLITNY